ncbi:hypothetical protein BDV26DRAFT_292670 [Aspergillus bertholletiae]|uniref:SnoaL-like domain-containing protein n=1 Tax=Aspergillus bertholletiae TaxID=1226010 RepID=A0A5N7B875_9EURO|nr:hypothetical protein BDV26DRAFT_292670 [Aspergillus bertholletiae]
MFFKQQPPKERDTLWPESLPQDIKLWIITFFELLDGYTPEAGRRWSCLYAPDGEFIAFGQVFQGPTAIEGHIRRFWDMFPGLSHHPKRVYANGDTSGPCLELAVVTSYAITFSMDNFVAGESVALFVLERQETGLVLRQNKLFLEPSLLMKGLEASDRQLPTECDKATSSHVEDACEIRNEYVTPR